MKTTIELPDDLHRQVKAKAAMEGTNIAEVVRGFLIDWVGKAENAFTRLKEHPEDLVEVEPYPKPPTHKLQPTEFTGEAPGTKRADFQAEGLVPPDSSYTRFEEVRPERKAKPFLKPAMSLSKQAQAKGRSRG